MKHLKYFFLLIINLELKIPALGKGNGTNRMMIGVAVSTKTGVGFHITSLDC